MSSGERLRGLREQRGWTQEDLAARAGISDSYVSKVEVGGKPGSMRFWRRVALALGVDVGLLVSGSGRTTPTITRSAVTHRSEAHGLVREAEGADTPTPGVHVIEVMARLDHVGLREGDLLAVEVDGERKAGDLVLVRWADTGAMWLRRIGRIASGVEVLLPADGQTDTVILDPDRHEVVGPVVELRRFYR